MLIRKQTEFGLGYTALTPPVVATPAVQVDFGILRLAPGGSYADDSPRERAFLLLHGEASLRWDRERADAERSSMCRQLPAALHAPAGLPVRITAGRTGAEFAVHRTANPRPFPARFVGPGDVRVVSLRTASLPSTERELRTVLDDDNAPDSDMTLGELVNFPGLWSSYPPHHHPHPEIYHYRFEPEGGFGYAQVGDEVHLVRDGDTVVITPNEVHPQVAAPGYAMVYVWTMLHLPGNRFGAGSRIFTPEHDWLRK